MPASPWHDHGAERLKEILKAAAEQVGADVYVAGGPNDVSTTAGIRKPDVFVVPKDVACSAMIGDFLRARKSLMRMRIDLCISHWWLPLPAPSAPRSTRSSASAARSGRVL